MNILHLSTSDCGGAGIACMRLHDALCKHSPDISSKVLVLHKTISPDTVYQYVAPKRTVWQILKRALQDRLRRKGIHLNQQMKDLSFRERALDANVGFVSLPYGYPELLAHPLFEWADLIHIHWVAGFIDYNTFFENIRKSYIWTIHDHNIFYGSFHTQFSNQHTSPQLQCEDLEVALRKQKAILRGKFKPHFVQLSRAMHDKSMQHPFTSKFSNSRIPLCIDPNFFYPIDKKVAKLSLGMDPTKIHILFIASELDVPWKGFSEFIKFLALLRMDDIAVILVGASQNPIHLSSYKVYSFQSIQSTDLLRLIYSASDIHISASTEESFGQTLLESIACGTPVISTPHYGAKDMIQLGTGYLCSGFTAENLLDGFSTFLDTTHSSFKVTDIDPSYSPIAVAIQYQALYLRVQQSGIQ